MPLLRACRSDNNMADESACVEQGDATPPESQLQEIPIPESLAPLAKLALKYCKLYACVGSSFRVQCNLCGLGEAEGIVTSAHKLTYRHYLGEKGDDIAKCLSLGKLKEKGAAWVRDMEERQTKLQAKRK